MTEARHASSIVSQTAMALMDMPTETNLVAQQLKIRLLYGLFEADASGTIAIAAALIFLVLVGVGCWSQIW